MDSLHNLARYATGRSVFVAAKKNPKELTALNRHGETPLDVARKAGNKEAERVLAGLAQMLSKEAA